MMKMAIAVALSAFASVASACPGREARCDVDGGQYLVLTPEEAPVGALLFLHGWGATAEAALSDPGVVDPALARGYAVIAPQGEPRRPGERGGRWNSRADPRARDDVAFLSQLLDDASTRFGFERKRVLVAGFSGGGMMVWRVACDAPGAAAAYAPVAGLLWRPLPEVCDGPAPLLHVQGWTDAVVPIEGRTVGGGALTQGDLFAGLDLMRRTNGCDRDDPDAYGSPGGFLVRWWTACDAPLGLALHPGGHVTPEGWTDLALDWLENAGSAD